MQMTLAQILMLISGGALAGFIDSIAGGGGLVSLPLLSLFLHSGVDAIGSNKIVGTTGALVALLVYARAGHLQIRKGFLYVVVVATGSVCGSLITPRLAPSFLFHIIIVACLGMGVLVVTKPYWWPDERRRSQRNAVPRWLLYAAALLVGCYDGAIGPGGGTFMLLVLLLCSDFSVLQSLALSKLANTASAGFSLVSYAIQGHVVVLYGVLVALGMSIGAWVGARLALKRAEYLIRPLLLVVTTLLVVRLWRQWQGF